MTNKCNPKEDQTAIGEYATSAEAYEALERWGTEHGGTATSARRDAVRAQPYNADQKQRGDLARWPPDAPHARLGREDAQ